MLKQIIAAVAALLKSGSGTAATLQEIKCQIAGLAGLVALQGELLAEVRSELQAIGISLKELTELVNPTKAVKFVFAVMENGVEVIYQGDRPMILKAGQSQLLKLVAVDKFNNPTAFDETTPPSWASSNPENATVTPDEADVMQATITTVGPVGNSQITVTADADIGPTDKPIIGVLDLEVIAGDAVSVRIEPVGPPIEG